MHKFQLKIAPFPFLFYILPHFQRHCTILDGYQIQNGLAFWIVSAYSLSSEIP